MNREIGQNPEQNIDSANNLDQKEKPLNLGSYELLGVDPSESLMRARDSYLSKLNELTKQKSEGQEGEGPLVEETQLDTLREAWERILLEKGNSPVKHDLKEIWEGITDNSEYRIIISLLIYNNAVMYKDLTEKSLEQFYEKFPTLKDFLENSYIERLPQRFDRNQPQAGRGWRNAIDTFIWEVYPELAK